MKAKEKFLIEATKQFGENAIITKSQVQDISKFGYYGIWLWSFGSSLVCLLVTKRLSYSRLMFLNQMLQWLLKKKLSKRLLKNISRQRNG